MLSSKGAEWAAVQMLVKAGELMSVAYTPRVSSTPNFSVIILGELPGTC